MRLKDAASCSFASFNGDLKEQYDDRNFCSLSNEHSIFAAPELSKNNWLLAIQVPGRDNPSLHPIKGGDAEGLMAKLGAARERTIIGLGYLTGGQRKEGI